MEETRAISNDLLVRGTAADGNVRCMAAVTTNLVAEAVARHRTSPTVSAAFGRVLTGSLLLGSGLKELDRLTVQIVCDGPIGGITAEVKEQGRVRGYVRNPEADASLNHAGKFDVSTVIGNGTFYVTHESGYDIGLYREPYRGSVPIISGEIAEDFAHYLTKSEQIPSAVMLGVLMRARTEGELFVEAAGGLMIQILPGADPRVVAIIEETVRSAPHTTTMIREGASSEDLLRTALGNIQFEVLEERLVEFSCSCSYERAASLISSIDAHELNAMLREDGGAAMTCHFCNETYRFNAEELERMIAVKVNG